MIKVSKLNIAFIYVILLCSCARVITEKGEYILKKNSIYENNIYLSNSSEKYNLIKQKPNKYLFGTFPVETSIHSLADKTAEKNIDSILNNNPNYKKTLETIFSTKGVGRIKLYYKNINEWLIDQGEPHRIYSPSKKKVSANNLRLFYNNIGFLDANVNTKTKIKDNTINVNYYIETGKQYKIERIKEDIKSETISKIYKDNLYESLIQKGDILNINTLSKEINRLTKLIKNSGFYYFNKQFISYEVDTLNKKNKCDLTIIIKAPYSTSNQDYLKAQKINKVYVHIDDNKSPKKDSLKSSLITIIGKNIKYSPTKLENHIFITPDKIYSTEDIRDTYRNLNMLDNFSQTKIKINSIDTLKQKLDVNIFLNTMKKNSLLIAPQIERSNTRYGTNIKTSLISRNLFGGAENLETSVNVSLEIFKKTSSLESLFFNAWEISLDSKLKFPRIILLPFLKNLFSKDMYPYTTIGLSLTNQSNIGVGKINFTFNFSHSWKPNNKVNNILSLINSTFSTTLRKDKYFETFPRELDKKTNLISLYKDYNPKASEGDEKILTLIKDDENFLKLDKNKQSYINYIEMMERKNRITKNEFILSSSYKFIYNSRGINLNNTSISNNFYMNSTVELAGYIPYFISKVFDLDKDENNQYKIFNIPYSQYLKLDLDLRYYFKLIKKNTIALRFLSGIIIPHGNSNSIPFHKSYFAGGSNDIRAWQAYSLGPGGNKDIGSYYKTGALKLLTSIEYRFNLINKFNSAIFFDVGNIWEINSNYEDKNFNISNFINQLAIGSGIGIRYDFGILIFRLDIAFPLYNPSNKQGERWVINKLNFNDLIYNFGIGYPF